MPAPTPAKSLLPMTFAAALALGAWTVSGEATAEPFISEGGAEPDSGYQVVTLAEGLENPWGMAWLPDGAILITERDGQLRILRNGALAPEPIRGVPEVYADNQGGLLDVATHPQFASNGLIYLTYSAGERSANRTTVARGALEGDRLVDVQVIFEVADDKRGGAHFGSRLLWLPDGTLLVSIGDGGNPPVSFDGDDIRLQAQKLGTHFGKLIRLNDDGSIPQDNPFVGQDGVRPEIWSYGHRNIQGLTRDPETGAIWANEHGARRGDELNRVEVSQNFGWPAATHSRNYGFGTEISPHTSLPDMVDPIVVWMRTKAPSGLAVYRGSVFAEWDGDLLSGGLVSEDIRRIELNADGTVASEHMIEIDERVRDVRVGPDGHIYVLTDESDGRLLRLDPQ